MPREINANRQFRAELLELAATNEHLQQLLIKICRADILFWVNVFVWTFQPRDRTRPTVRPMITWPKQDELLTTIVDLVRSGEDHPKLNVEKSREQGGSWCVLVAFDWFCRFSTEPETFLIASRNAEMVDDAENTDTLFSKLDFLQSQLPTFMQKFWIDRHRVESQIKYTTDCVINGQATTTDLGRSGRRTAGFLDEASKMKNQSKIDKSVNDAWHLRIKVATPDGPHTEFSRDRNRPGVRFLTMHWSENPQHNAGLYIPHEDHIEYVDQAYWTPERIAAYDFAKYIEQYPTSNPRFLMRSPYYDRECETRSRSDIAENMDINDYGNNTLFYAQNPAMRDDYHAMKKLCRQPCEFGMLEYDHETGQPISFQPSTAWGKIRFQLWIPTGGRRPPSDRRYGIGFDISQGTGFSNSTMAIVDLDLKSKIGELATAWMDPREFAVCGVAMARWFNNAKMIWGKQGSGIAFSKRVYELGYRNVFSRSPDPWNDKWNSTPGVSEDQDSKLGMHTLYRSALYSGQFENPSEPAIVECLQYQYNENGYVEHSTEGDPEDTSDAKKNHGDLVVADAMANILLGAPTVLKTQDDEPDVPAGPRPYTLAWRMAQREQHDVDTYSNDEMIAPLVPIYQ